MAMLRLAAQVADPPPLKDRTGVTWSFGPKVEWVVLPQLYLWKTVLNSQVQDCPGGSSHEAQVVHNSVFVLPGLQLLQGLALMSSSPDLPQRARAVFLTGRLASGLAKTEAPSPHQAL